LIFLGKAKNWEATIGIKAVMEQMKSKFFCGGWLR